MILKEIRVFVFFYAFIGSSKMSLSLDQSYEFNKSMTGVVFIPPYNLKNQTYTCRQLKAMLQVVSSKFSKIVTGSMHASEVGFLYNDTDNYHFNMIARTIEAAAMINREQNSRRLHVTIGITNYDKQHGGGRRTEAEINLAVKASKMANSIYPGSVGGFQLSNVLSDAQSAISGIYWLNYLRNRVESSGLRVGINSSLSDVHKMDILNYVIRVFNSSSTGDPRIKLIENSDFIVCNFFANEYQSLDGPIENFSLFSKFLLTYKSLFELINPKIVTMGYSGWSSSGIVPFQNIENLKKYWIAFDEFATKNNYPVWFHEAFDNPWHFHLGDESPFYGWWRSNENEELTMVTAYVENILSPRYINLTSLDASTGPPKATSHSVADDLIWPSIAIGVVCSIITVPIFVILLYLCKRKISLGNSRLCNEIIEFRHGVAHVRGDEELNMAPLRKPYNLDLEISREMLEIYPDQILGTGHYGPVLKAVIKGESPKAVALKSTEEGCSKDILRSLLREIKVLSHIGTHPNIVSICGACTSDLFKGIVYVALELCEMGSLRDHLISLSKRVGNNEILANENDGDLEKQLLRWSLDICEGMEHIAKMGVIHMDLATRNVLLTSNGTAKVTDFGMSSRLNEYSEYIKSAEIDLPWKWMAIESLKTQAFSHQSDVWSFGVTLWEIFSLGDEPYPGYFYNWGFVEDLENGLAIMNHPIKATSEIYQIIIDCRNLQADLRPAFATLKFRISEIICNESVYDVLYDII